MSCYALYTATILHIQHLLGLLSTSGLYSHLILQFYSAGDLTLVSVVFYTSVSFHECFQCVDISDRNVMREYLITDFNVHVLDDYPTMHAYQIRNWLCRLLGDYAESIEC